MPGAGKSTFAEVAKGMGFEVINMGDMVREETRRQNLELTDANLGNVMLIIRKKYGAAAVAQLCIEKIERSSSNLFVIDGLRSIQEIDAFKKVGNVKVLSIQASPGTRYKFLASRRRKDAPLDERTFTERDARELTVGIGGAIALADHIMVNNGITIDEFKKRASEFLRHAKANTSETSQRRHRN